MAIRLVDKDEKFTLEISGCKFFYRRLPADVAAEIRKRCTRRGVVDQNAAADEAFRYCLLGWEGVEDAAGAAATFTVEAAMALPDPVKVELAKAIFGTVGGDEDDPEGLDPLEIFGATSGQ